MYSNSEIEERITTEFRCDSKIGLDVEDLSLPHDGRVGCGLEEDGSCSVEIGRKCQHASRRVLRKDPSHIIRVPFRLRHSPPTDGRMSGEHISSAH